MKLEYAGIGTLALEIAYKHLILLRVEDYGKQGMTLEDGMFLVCDSAICQSITMRSYLSSADLGNEGIFNLSLRGKGIVALESNIPMAELIEVELENDTIKIDGDLAVCWSTSLDFSVEKSSKTLLGSAINGEGFVNVYRGTRKILMSPVMPSDSYYLVTYNR